MILPQYIADSPDFILWIVIVNLEMNYLPPYTNDNFTNMTLYIER